MRDERAARAESLLRELGVEASVSVEGHEREIAALTVPGAAWERMLGEEGARLARRVKALGFRYVAVDLAPFD